MNVEFIADKRSWKVAISPTRQTRDETTPEQIELEMLTLEFTIGERVKESPKRIVEGVIADLHLTGKVEYTLVPAKRCSTMPCPHIGCNYVGLPTSLAVHYQKEHMDE